MPSVKVKFINDYKSRSYIYTTPEGDWKPGDLAVVDSPSSGFTLTEVLEVLPDSYKGNKPVVGMISLDAYRLHKANLARKAEILAQLERAEKARAETERFRHLAVLDPSLSDLIEELKALD